MFLPMRLICNILLITLSFSSRTLAIGTDFLVLPSTASELALGSQTGMTGDSRLNPASQNPRVSGITFDFSMGSWLDGVRASSLNIGYSLFNGQARTGFRFYGLDDIDFYDDQPSDQPLSSWGAYGISLDGSWSRKIGANQFGVGIHLLQIQLQTESSSGVGFDLGYIRAMGNKLTIGGAILNLGRMNTLMETAPDLPLRIAAGIAYKFSHPDFPTILGINGEWSQQREQLIYNIGSQTNWKFMSLRLSTQVSPEVVTVSGGFALNFGRYAVGYSIRFGSQQVGVPQMLDLSILVP